MLSVVVAVYNAEKYLNRCIDSILHQTFDNWELILVNDGSTDHSLEICREYERQDRRIRVFSMKNQGPAAARNLGLKHVKGDLWTTLDSDDWIAEDAFEIAIACMEKYQVEMVVYGFQFTDGVHTWDSAPDRLRQGLYTENDCRTFFLDFIYRKGNKINPFLWLRIMKMDLIQKNNIYFNEELKRSEDYCFLSCIHQKVKKMYVMTEEKKVFYFQNQSSITHSYIKDYWDMIKRVYLLLWEKAGNDSLMKNRLEYMLIYRARIALQNELRSNQRRMKKYEQIVKIMNDKLLRAKCQKLSILKYMEEFGKKNLLIKLRMAALYMFFNS